MSALDIHSPAQSLARYPAYKDSGIDWIGEIPVHWEVKSNKYIFNLKKVLVGKNSSKYELLSLTLKGIVKRDLENPEGKFPAEFDSYQVVRKNDFVFCLFDVEETPRTVGLSEYNGMITGAYTVMEANSETYPKFLYYYYLNADNGKKLKYLYKGLRNTIPKESFFSLKTVLPPFSEQAAIAEFLDKKCEQIDRLIRIKEQQIERLQELRQAKIHQAVTKGLNPNVPLKDSGIDWIGEIPEHWEVKRIKYLFKEINERSDSGNEDLLSVSQYTGVTLTSESIEEGDIITNAATLEGYKKVKKHHLVTNIMLAWNGSLGFSEFDGIVSPAYCVYELREGNFYKYFHYLFRTEFYKAEFKRNSSGIVDSRLRLYTEDFFSIWSILPPLSEQSAIAEFLDKVTNQIDQTINHYRNQIEKLKEYKQSLINAAVTGKINVA